MCSGGERGRECGRKEEEALNTDRGEPWPAVREKEFLCRLQRCVKDLSRLLEKVSGKATLEKTGLQQLDRTLGDVARILGGKVNIISWFPLSPSVPLFRLRMISCVSRN